MKTQFTEKDFERLFRDYFKPLVNFANKFLNDIEESKEIVHEVFTRLWEKRDSIDMSNSVKSYIYKSVNNKCLNFIRDNKKFTDAAELEKSKSATRTEQSLETLEIQAIIDRTLENLTPKVRQVFILSRNEHLKYNEIAEKLGISVKTVESHISKALKELRKNLKEYLTLLVILCLNL